MLQKNPFLKFTETGLVVRWRKEVVMNVLISGSKHANSVSGPGVEASIIAAKWGKMY